LRPAHERPDVFDRDWERINCSADGLTVEEEKLDF
jgi:hypothetical protein